MAFQSPENTNFSAGICLLTISKLAEQVVITVTDDDNALKTAQLLMRGGVRTGTADAEIIEEAFLLRNDIRNVEIIDVSAGKEERGFDIVGHHYWYRHPWMSSDIIFLMRTDFPSSRIINREHRITAYISAHSTVFC